MTLPEFDPREPTVASTTTAVPSEGSTGARDPGFCCQLGLCHVCSRCRSAEIENFEKVKTGSHLLMLNICMPEKFELDPPATQKY